MKEIIKCDSPEFKENLPFYRMAWSPLYQEWVHIVNVRKNEHNDLVLTCEVEGRYTQFEPHELFDYQK